jgi:hypothetical protein
MRIIIDTNIIYTNSLIKDSLPRAFKSFLDTCSKKGHEIIIALTTKLEFDRKQRELREKEIRELNNANKLLSNYNVKLEHFEPEKLVSEPDLLRLILDCKVKVNLVEPEISDFKYAHEKACLHLPPHPPDIKSDEMRDLVVWSIALRFSSLYNGNTLLISNDEVHVHPRGDEEAEKVGLIRVNSLESALEYMDVETPNGKLVMKLLDLSWEDLIKNGIPLKDKPNLSGVNNVRFLQGNNGPSEVAFKMVSKGQDNKDFRTDVKMNIKDNVLKTIILNNLTLGSEKMNDIQIDLNIEINLFDNDFDQRMESLKKLLNTNS